MTTATLAETTIVLCGECNQAYELRERSLKCPNPICQPGFFAHQLSVKAWRKRFADWQETRTSGFMLPSALQETYERMDPMPTLTAIPCQPVLLAFDW